MSDIERISWWSEDWEGHRFQKPKDMMLDEIIDRLNRVIDFVNSQEQQGTQRSVGGDSDA